MIVYLGLTAAFLGGLLAGVSFGMLACLQERRRDLPIED